MKTFESLNITGINISKGGNQKTTCPVCAHTRKNRHDKSLSVNVPQGVGLCHHCGWKFSINERIEKVYFKPEPSPIPLSPKTMSWFDGRKISESTLRHFKITESKQWMPEKGTTAAGERNCINFNYYRQNDLVNVKFRDAAKCFRLVKDAELIFYNLSAIENTTEAIICEGEIDALTFHECGFPMVVSVPNGASKGGKLEYLDNCIDYFLAKERIYIATDGDDAGILLKDELIRRLGADKCFEVKYPEGCKDSNEVLCKFGKDAVRGLITTAVAPPVNGVFQIEDLNEQLDEIFKNGYPKATPIGYTDLDKFITWRKGELTIITGIPSHGKSDFIDQISVRLAIRNEWRFAVFSPENQPPEIHIIKLIEKFVGKPYYRYDNTETMNEATKNYAKQILNDNYFFMKIDEMDLTIDGILEKTKELIQRKGIDALIIDPYNYIEHNIPSGYSETQYISELLTKIKRFKDANNIHIFLVAHPRKISKIGKTHDVPTLYDIAGSAHFYNKADNGITVYRNDETNLVDIHIQKVRFRFVGKKGLVTFTYDLPTGRYAEMNTDYESQMQWLINEVKKDIDNENKTKGEPPF
jgi:twinkle protein